MHSFIITLNVFAEHRGFCFLPLLHSGAVCSALCSAVAHSLSLSHTNTLTSGSTRRNPAWVSVILKHSGNLLLSSVARIQLNSVDSTDQLEMLIIWNYAPEKYSHQSVISFWVILHTHRRVKSLPAPCWKLEGFFHLVLPTLTRSPLFLSRDCSGAVLENPAIVKPTSSPAAAHRLSPHAAVHRATVRVSVSLV